MADHNEPKNTTLYTLVIGALRDLIADVAKMYDGTVTENIPVGAKKYDSVNNKFQQWNGSSWTNLGFHSALDSHINDTTLHSSVPVGCSLAYHGTVAPAGFLLEDGSAVSRSTYASLFAVIGTIHGAGDNSTTFNLPDSRGRSILGRTTGGLTSTMGYKFGAVDHAHSTPAHQHTVPSHQHFMGNHTHTTPGHTHQQTAHSHFVHPHWHSTQAPGATIAITGSGAHSHDIGRQGGGGTNQTNSRVAMHNGGITDNAGQTLNTSSSNHTHPHENFTGIVGNAVSTPSGDSGFNTDGGDSGAYTTGVGGAGTSGGPSTNLTDFSGNITTLAGEGAMSTGVASHACLVATRIIKF